MKRTMAAVIVGPTIGSSVSVFASERKRCGTAANANWQTIKAESECFDMWTVDKTGARFEHDVNPETGMPEARREGRS